MFCVFHSAPVPGSAVSLWEGSLPGSLYMFSNLKKKKKKVRGAWVTELVKSLTLAFSSGHDPSVVGSSPTSGSLLSVEPAWDSFSPSPCSPPQLMLSLSLSLKINK